MSGRRAVLVWVTGWCLVVVAVSTVVWAVIGRAGQGVVPVAEPEGQSTGSVPVPSRSHHPSPHPSRSPSRTPTASTSAPPTTPPATTSSAPVTVPPTTAPTSAPPTTSSPAQPTSPTSSAPPPPPDTRRGSWSGSGGGVVAECTGSRISLVSAYANAGWRYEIGDRGPDRVEVKLSQTGEEGREVDVRARCASGAPAFSTESDAHDG